MVNQYQHEIVLEIGPFQEWEGKKGPVDLKLVSNGDLGSMKIRVHIQKSKIQVPNLARISVWNLNRETIDSLNTAGKEVRVFAGTQNGSKELVYTGSLVSVVTNRSGPDLITVLNCFAADSNLIRTNIYKTWAEGTEVDTIVREIVSQIPNIVYNIQNKKLEGIIGYKGFSFSGSAYDALVKLANQFGFSWSIDNGIFVATMDGKPIDTGILLTSKSGLRKVSPRLSGIDQIQEGVDVFCKYTQGIQPGHLFRVQSDVSPKLNGNYECHTIEYDLSPKENDWDMSITTFTLLGVDQ